MIDEILDETDYDAGLLLLMKGHDVPTDETLRTQVATLTRERDEARAECDVFAKAIEQEALIQVQNELNYGEECPDKWTIGIGGVVVEVHCADDSALSATIQRWSQEEIDAAKAKAKEYADIAKGGTGNDNRR